MKILLVEDDENKRAHVASFIREIVPDVTLCSAKSYNAAIREIANFMPEIVLLDMSLPVFDVTAEEDGYQFDAFAGVEVLNYAKRRNHVCSFIVLTQFETLGEGAELISSNELGANLEKQFPDLFRALIFYSPAESSWREQLKKILL